jgi:FkbM family methyltransferase
MNSKNKKLIAKFLFWKYLPKTFRAQIQCSLYSNKKILYAFKGNHFITRYKKDTIVKTIENPYGFNYYDSLFFDGYTPQKDDVIIDAGGFDGHVGSLLALLVGSKGMVYSFEPDTNNQNKILDNKTLNNLKNLEIIDQGLWSTNTELKFYSNGSVGSSVFYDPGESKEIKIKVTSIDNFVKEKGLVKIDFIKMNIEGSEIEAIKGAFDTLSKFKPKIAVTADHTVNGVQTYNEIIRLLTNANYSTRLKRVGTGAIVVIAEPPIT